jgi:O-antigen/teichoic acid export membrane protein
VIGFISLAGNLGSVVSQFLLPIAGKVLIPACAELARSGDHKRLARLIDRSKLLVTIPSWLFSLSIALLGPVIINTLYDERYWGAGVFLQIMGISGMLSSHMAPYNGILMAIDRPGLGVLTSAFKAIVTVAAIFIGHLWMGPIGVVLSPIVSAVVIYPLNAYIFHRLGLWRARIEVPVFFVSVIISGFVLSYVDLSGINF